MIQKKNSTEKNRVFRKRMKERGYSWVCAWVPIEYREKVKDFIKSLRAKKI